ncbi:hypothetical protein Ancab_009179 [Ancistrocladus abbreviatus]
MVSVNPSSEGIYLDANGMALPGLDPFTAVPATSTTTTTTTTNTTPSSDDSSRKFRKPYTITKSRDSWTEAEHDKFFEALHLFDRDWKKIEACVGSKTVIQIRSHAQKYFLKVQKSGKNEHLPPPRPKRKAAHPYPQKSPKNAVLVSKLSDSSQSSSVLLEPGCQRPDLSSMPRNPGRGAAVPSWTANCAQPIRVPHVTKGDVRSTVQLVPNNCSSSTESTAMAEVATEVFEPVNHGHSLRVLPDFVQVYSFVGSVFDPDAKDHLQKLRKMDPIDVETVLLLMRNLSINLSSPDFEDHTLNHAHQSKNACRRKSWLKYEFPSTEWSLKVGYLSFSDVSVCVYVYVSLLVTREIPSTSDLKSTMIIPEKNRREMCKYLFQEGVCYAKKDYNLTKHPEINVPNYRTCLNLPSEIVPATLKKQAKPIGHPMGGPPGDRPRFGDCYGYRGGPHGPPGDFGGGKGGAPADYQPSFRGAGRRPDSGCGAGGFGGEPAAGSGFAQKSFLQSSLGSTISRVTSIQRGVEHMFVL